MSGIDRRICWIVAVGLWACQTDGVSSAQPASAQTQTATTKSGSPAQNLVNAYITLQSKLAQDDAAGAKSAFTSVASASKAKGLSLDPALQKKLANAAQQGASASKLADARVAFSLVTEAMLTYLSSAKNPLSATLTVAHCPMALDNKGAKWLQVGEKLENPYFGSEMLRCGTVDKTVQPGKGL